MRVFIENVVDKDTVKMLYPGKQDFDNTIIKGILAKIEDVIGKRCTNPPSYATIEQGEKGHNWHTDIGTNGHMKWCNYGISVLLKKSKGGLFKYKAPYKEYTQDEHYLNALVHSNDECHKVDKSTKGRTVLLMFLQ